jgi:hypothetical protein
LDKEKTTMSAIPIQRPIETDAELAAALVVIDALLDATRREHERLRRALDRAEARFAPAAKDE